MGMVWPAGPAALTVDTVSAAGLSAPWQVSTRAVWLLALVLTETGGTDPATVTVSTGPAGTGTVLATVSVPAGTSWQWTPGTPGVPCPAGVVVDVTAGTLDVSVTTGETTT